METTGRTEDAALIERAARNDAEAFGALLERYEERVTRVAASILRDPDAALDVAQEVFIALHKLLPRWQPRAALFTWLYRTAVNTALAHSRRESRHRHVDLTGAEEAPPAPGDDEASRAVARALRGLPDRQRAVLTLKLTEELTFREIAGILGISASSAKTHLARGLAALRAKLGKYGDA